MTDAEDPADVSADDLRRYLTRKLRTAAEHDRAGMKLLTENPAAVTELVMAIVGPVLAARDAELAELREQAVLGPVPPGALL